MIISRKETLAVNVGGVKIGGLNPVVVQSMTNTDTADITSTVKQIVQLSEAGSEIIRLTVNNDESAKAIPHIKEQLLKQNIGTPLAGCFHYNGHYLLETYPDCASTLDKYRINPGNVGFGKKQDLQFSSIIESAIKYDKAVRIGVNWGSLDQAISKRLMDENAKLTTPKSSKDVLKEALITSALESAQKAIDVGISPNKIILSCKVSNVQDLVDVYSKLSKRTNYPLHLGLTEAGMGSKGIVSSTAALSILLQQGIGDTIRISLTPKPNETRTTEVKVAKEILQSLGLRSFTPQVIACPGCGRTTSTVFQELAEDIESYLSSSMPIWKEKYKGVEEMNVAVMGCIVNGPGESKHADIGISLPGTGESPSAPVFIDGKKATTLKGNKIAKDFQSLVDKYVKNRFG